MSEKQVSQVHNSCENVKTVLRILHTLIADASASPTDMIIITKHDIRVLDHPFPLLRVSCIILDKRERQWQHKK